MKRSIWENLIPSPLLSPHPPPTSTYPHPWAEKNVPTLYLPPPQRTYSTPKRTYLPPPPPTYLPPPHLPTPPPPPTCPHLPAPTHQPPPPAPPPTSTYPHPWAEKNLTLFMLYWSTIFVISSVFFWYSDFVQVRVEIFLHDDSSRFRYSTGYVFLPEVLFVQTLFWPKSESEKNCRVN